MTVLVGYRPGPLGAAALEAAIRETRRSETDLLVVHVSSTRPNREATTPAFESESDHVRSMLEASGVPYEIRQIVTEDGVPAHELLALAEEIDAEQIVIGVRTRSSVGKFLMGSTAQTVIIDAPCPVLAVKA